MSESCPNLILHFLFVDYMMLHISTSTKLKDEFVRKYSKELKITGGWLMKTILGMQVEQGLQH